MVQTASKVTSNTAGLKSKRVANWQGKFWGSGKPSAVFQAGRKAKKPLGKVNQNKIPENIHAQTAEGTCRLPFLNVVIQRTPEPEHTRTETSRKAQTGGGFGKWVKSFKLEKETIHE